MLNIIKSLSFLKKILIGSNFAISYSGGFDSFILLEALKDIKNCTLIHVNHNLNSQSFSWEDKCINDAIRYNLNIKIIRIRLSVYSIKKMGLEGACRFYRYLSISKYLRNNNIHYLVTGHNLNDLVETCFLNIFRGCGLFGLKPISTVSFNFGIFIIRPFIKIPRDSLLRFFKPSGEFIVDYSNFSFRFKRNIIRFILSNYISKYFINYNSSILRNIYLVYTYIKFLGSTARYDINITSMFISKIRQLSDFRVRNIIIYIIRFNGFNIKSKSWVDEIIRQIFLYKKKRMLVISNNVRITLEKERLVFSFIEASCT
ncbi:tRNA lysidine(34) synthetase TilS [Candidatus Vidania fulgoroideorum]